jgi:YVTN family beta-propeller protein
VNPRCLQFLAVAALAAAWPGHSQQPTAATFGNVISLAGGTPSDVVLDEARHRLYLVNYTTNLVYVFDYTTNSVVAQVPVGSIPYAGAMSMDGRYLYVTSNGTSSLNMIDLNTLTVVQTVVLPSKPQGVEVGSDGRALVSMAGVGVVAGVPQGTLSIFDPTLALGQQLLPVTVPALATTPSTLPPVSATRPVTPFVSKLLRTPDGHYIVGAITPTGATTYVFVYEVASGVVLRNRTISGQSTVLSMAPDGSRFMAGYTMFDIGTLNILAQQNNANAPFPFNVAFNTTANIGGSVFSPDGSTLYSAFNVAATANPAPPPNSSTLLVNDPASLAIHLGIKLPESIVAKLVMLSDGSEAWGLSDSGLVHLPLGNLYNYPILAPETMQVFLAMDDCNHGLASAGLKMNNLGKGKLTFNVATTANAALEYQISSGLAPAAIAFTMDPGRTGVSRQPGTNMWTATGGNSQGTAFNVTLSSPEAINIPNTIRVYMNYRQNDQRGIIFPVPTTPNSSAGGTTNANGNEGLQDLVLDEARGRLYLTNSGFNRIEVFDTKNQQFLAPIPVGQMPHQMAMGTDGNTLYVANTGGESVSIVDLNLQQVVGSVVFPPIPRNGTVNPVYPRTLAMGLVGLQFVMSDGSQWSVVGNTAIPRTPNTSVIPLALGNTGGAGPAFGMIASSDNNYILTLSGDGHAYIYNSSAPDSYVAGRLLFSPIQGYYGALGAGPGGAYFLANGLILSPSLTTIGGSALPSTPSSTGSQRNVAAAAPIDANSFLWLTTPVRASITAATTDDPRTTLQRYNLTTGSLSLVGVAPENPIASVFGTTRFNTTARQMVVDSAGTTAYAITLSGLSVIPLAATGTGTQPAISAGGVVNASNPAQAIQPGSFITIKGTNLASTATAATIPPPTVLGGSCVTFGNVALPLLSASPTQIQAQVPDNLVPGTQIVSVRSLALAQDSAPVTVSVRSAAAADVPPAGGNAARRRAPSGRGAAGSEMARPGSR